MTIREFLEKSLRQIKVLAAGESADGDTIQDALLSFNILMDAWNAEGLIRSKGGISSQAITAAQTFSFTNSTIDPSAVYGVNHLPDSQTAQRELQILTVEQFQIEMTKTVVTGTYAEKIYFYKDLSGDLKGYLFPTPSGTGTLKFFVQERFTATNSNLSSDFPVELVGYQRALLFNLALEMCPEFGVQPDAVLIKNAEESKAQVMRSNFEPIIINADFDFSSEYGFYDINKG